LQALQTKGIISHSLPYCVSFISSLVPNVGDRVSPRTGSVDAEWRIGEISSLLCLFTQSSLGTFSTKEAPWGGSCLSAS